MFLLGLAGLAFAAILLAIIFNFDRPEVVEPALPEPSTHNVIELLPKGLGPDEMPTLITELSRDANIAFPQGGWIQIADRENPQRIAQRYRNQAMDPNPAGHSAGWLEMKKPEVEVYLSNHRILTLRSERGFVYAPNRSLESGEMLGDVVIRLYELEEDRKLEADDSPALEVQTQHAEFDNIQGEVLCANEVDIQTPTMHLPGAGLRIQFNESTRIVQLGMQQVGKIRLASVDETLDSPEPEQQVKAPQDKATPKARAEAAPKPPRSGAAASAAQPQTQPQFYRLTLRNNVQIEQASSGWSAAGDELNLIFAMDSRTMTEPQPQREPAPRKRSNRRSAMTGSRSFILNRSISNPMSDVNIAIAALAIAAVEPATAGLYQSQPDEVVITCAGGMTMLPLDKTEDLPASRDDSRLELVGAPLRLQHATNRIDVTCANLVYHTLPQRMMLVGDDAHPLDIDSPQMRASAQRLRFDRLDHHGAFEGPGWLVARESTAPLAPAAPEVAMVVEVDQLRIQWRDGVDLAFDKPAEPETDSLGPLRSAAFTGDVATSSADFQLRSQALTVSFDGPAGDDVLGAASDTAQVRRHVKSVNAAHDVRAMSADGKGTIACESLDIDFVQDAHGRTIPKQLLAITNVAAHEPGQQTMWCDRLLVNFRAAASPAADAVEASQHLASQQIEVSTLRASGDVQVLTADGARAFADQLDADSDAQLLALWGEDVIVSSGNAVLDRGKRLEVYNDQGKAIWPGPGRFITYAQPLELTSHQRIARPDLSSRTDLELVTTWRESMTYDSRANDNAGEITLIGDVNGLSTPTPLEQNTFFGQSLVLAFAPALVDATSEEAAGVEDLVEPETRRRVALEVESEQSASDRPLTIASLSSGPRRLKNIIATGDAKIESHTWLKPDHSDPSRIFYIAGDHINYDNETSEAHVPTAGVLLVRDERPPTLPASPGAVASAATPTPFSSKGTTQFNWTDHLHMTRITPIGHEGPALFNIDMRGDVQGRHLDLDKSVSTFTGDRLEAVVARDQYDASDELAAVTGAASNPAAAAPAAAPLRQTTFDLGGSMTLTRLSGTGRIYIDSPTRDVECEMFDYNYETGVATLTAQPGRTVTVLTAGNPTPLRAQRVMWNMRDDTIVIEKPTGAAPR